MKLLDFGIVTDLTVKQATLRYLTRLTVILTTTILPLLFIAFPIPFLCVMGLVAVFVIYRYGLIVVDFFMRIMDRVTAISQVPANLQQVSYDSLTQQIESLRKDMAVYSHHISQIKNDIEYLRHRTEHFEELTEDYLKRIEAKIDLGKKPHSSDRDVDMTIADWVIESSDHSRSSDKPKLEFFNNLSYVHGRSYKHQYPEPRVQLYGFGAKAPVKYQLYKYDYDPGTTLSPIGKREFDQLQLFNAVVLGILCLPFSTYVNEKK